MCAKFRFLLGLLLISQMAFAAGFFKSADERLKEDAAKFPDKPLLIAFYPQDESLQRYRLDIWEDALVFSQGELAGYRSPEDILKAYRQTDYTQDAVASRFKKYAGENGLSVATYKSRINQEVSGKRTPQILKGRHGSYADQDSCMIATNSSGRMIAILYRFLKVEPNFATKGYTQYSIILVGDTVRRIEDQIPTSLLTDYKHAQ